MKKIEKYTATDLDNLDRTHGYEKFDMRTVFYIYDGAAETKEEKTFSDMLPWHWERQCLSCAFDIVNAETPAERISLICDGTAKAAGYEGEENVWYKDPYMIEAARGIAAHYPDGTQKIVMFSLLGAESETQSMTPWKNSAITIGNVKFDGCSIEYDICASIGSNSGYQWIPESDLTHIRWTVLDGFTLEAKSSRGSTIRKEFASDYCVKVEKMDAADEHWIAGYYNEVYPRWIYFTDKNGECVEELDDNGNRTAYTEEPEGCAEAKARLGIA